MKTIVVGYDGSESAQHALERAAALANGEAKITVVGAVHTVASKVGVTYDPVEAGGSGAASRRCQGTPLGARRRGSDARREGRPCGAHRRPGRIRERRPDRARLGGQGPRRAHPVRIGRRRAWSTAPRPTSWSSLGVIRSRRRGGRTRTARAPRRPRRREQDAEVAESSPDGADRRPRSGRRAKLPERLEDVDERRERR